jgi:hypothetical protein
MKPLVIAIHILLALVVSAGVLTTAAAQSTFAVSQSRTGSGTNTGTVGSGGTPDNSVNGKDINVHSNDIPRLNQNQSQGHVALGVTSDEKASCDNSENTGHSANVC